MILALRSVTHSRIAALSSSSEKKRRLRSRASTNRWTICTADLRFRFVARLSPAPAAHEAVMGGELLISPIDARLVARRLGDTGLEVVADDRLRHTADRGERVDMRADPVRQCLAPARFRVSVVRRAERGDKDVRLSSRRRSADRTPATVSPAQSTNSFSPATCVWRIVADTLRATRCTDRRTGCRRSRPCSARYSCHNSTSVTLRRLSSSCSLAQSAAGRSAWASPGAGNNRRSSSLSSNTSGIGQLRPTTSARRTYSPAAVLPTPAPR